jgi:hypothetical protein
VRRVPPDTATLVTVTGAPFVEVLVRVTVPVPARGLPPAARVMRSGLGVMDTVPGATPVPLKLTGDPVTATLPVIVSVPVTLAAGGAMGEKTTLMVQVAPKASVAPHVPPAAPAGLEKRGEEKASAIPVRFAVPVLLSVSVFAALVEPSTTVPKARGPPVTAATARGGTPVPVSATGEPVTAAAAVIVTDPVDEVCVVGEKTMLMVQVLVAASVAVQVPPAATAGRENGAVTTIVTPVRLAPPVLLSVRVFAALVVPVATFPKERDVGVTAAIGRFGGTNSTAPMSNPPPCGREVPKKS